MENINKENFFFEVKERFPVAFSVFGKWLDNFAIEIDWDKFIGFAPANNCSGCMDRYKFVDIPFVMQIGIILKFIDDHNDDFSKIHGYFGNYDCENLVNMDAFKCLFYSFMSNYDAANNPDHYILNPKAESDDDLPF